MRCRYAFAVPCSLRDGNGWRDSNPRAITTCLWVTRPGMVSPPWIAISSSDLTAQLKEQAAQIQKVSAQVEVNKPAPRTVTTK